MRKAIINPVTIIDQEATQLGAIVTSYDLIDRCEVRWSLFGSHELHTDTMTLSAEAVTNWGLDDKVVIEAVAAAKNLTITGWIDPPAPSGATGDNI
jgi:hypothetical protein